MSKIKDRIRVNLVGRIFGRLRVLSFSGRTTSRNSIWKCRCRCGTVVRVVSGELLNGDTKSCGCLNRELASKRFSKNLINKEFGRLKVISNAGSNKWGNIVWLCSCTCGQQLTVSSGHLLRGNTKSCGCLKKDWIRTFCSSFSCVSFLNLLESQFSITIQREFYLEGRLFDGKVDRILIEVDSDYWHRSKKAKRVDALKDEIALRNGYAIVRMRVNEVRVIQKRLKYYLAAFRKTLLLHGVL